MATSNFKRRSRQELEAQAVQTLKQHGLYGIPVDPVTLANRNGIKVHNAKFSDESLSGLISKRGENVTMLVNQSDPPRRKRFTIAHELGHHFLHLLSEQDGEFADTDAELKIDLYRDSENSSEATENRAQETEANQFAAALLMPAELVANAYKDTPIVTELAELFNVSDVSMAIRLEQLGLSE